MASPKCAGRGRLYGDSSLALLIHEIRCGFTIVNFPYFVNLAGETQYSLSGGRFTGVHMSEDSNISII